VDDAGGRGGGDGGGEGGGGGGGGGDAASGLHAPHSTTYSSAATMRQASGSLSIPPSAVCSHSMRWPHV